MAKTNNAGINSNEIQNTKDYADALDKLQNSLNGVNSALPEFSSGIDSGLKAIASKLPDVVNSMMKLNVQNKELAASGQKPINVFTQLASSLLSWNNLVSIGITLLATYGSTIIDWVTDMIKGQTTLSALGKAMKDNAIIMDAVIQTRLKGNQAAQGELTNLTALYRATQNHNLSLARQKEAVKVLKDQWPDTFKGLSDQAILTGKAADAYKNLKNQIIAASFAEAAKNKITQNAIRILDNQQKITKERAKNIKILKDLNKTQGDYDSYVKDPIVGDDGGTLISYENDLSKQKDLRATSDKILYDLATDTKLLNVQNDKLYAEIDKRVKLFGTTVLGYKNPPTNNPSKPQQPKSGNSSQPRYTEMLQAKSLDFTQSIELDKQNYQTELNLLNHQLAQKLIGQQQYNQQSQQLQDKYHAAIGDKIKVFSKEELASMQKLMQDMVDQEQDNGTVNDTIEQAKSIEEQKQKKITEVAEQYEQQRKEFALKTAQEVSNQALSMVQNGIRSQADAKVKNLEASKAAELNNSSLTATQKKAIEDKYQKQEAAVKVKAFKDEQKVSILQAVINGALAITKATSQTGILAPFVIPGIIAETAIQVATIAAQKPPQYAKGGMHYQSDGRGALLSGYSRTDDTNAYLRSGEAVVVSEAMRNPWARNLVSAINVAHGGRDFSVSNPGRGYAIGGIFTDGGNANRYYSQPANDVRDLANTLAYQMINNFPPVYVDVKDINTQQNILAQTINRVNL